jgi:hypothetical protein
MKKLLLVLTLSIGTAHAADEYYSIQTGSVAADVGGVTATGFFETNGFGKSGYIPGTETYNPVVIGFDITLSYEGQSVNLCTSLSYGCPHYSYYTGADDALLLPQGITATPKGLFCKGSCALYDVGNSGDNSASWFTFASGDATYQIGDRFVNGVGVGNILARTTVSLPASYSITGGGPSTTMPRAPELDAGSAAGALTLLIGMGLVLQGRRRWLSGG